MELFLMTRGKSDEVEEWARWMSTRHMPLKVKHGDGKESQIMTECQLRPIQLWGFVFPKENLDVVLNSLKLPSGEISEFKDGEPVYPIQNKLWALRKLLKAKPIPKPDPNAGVMFMPYDRIKHINVLGIGIREDGEMSPYTFERI